MAHNVDAIISTMSYDDILTKVLKGPSMAHIPVIENVVQREQYNPYENLQLWTLHDVVKYRCPQGWEKFFTDNFTNIYNISRILSGYESDGKVITPSKAAILAPYHDAAPENVRVIIIGQDPYQGLISFPDSQGNTIQLFKATGRAFSQHAFDDKRQPSLRNILNAVTAVQPNANVASNDLSYWGRQGVMLLNTSLTGDVATSNAHGMIWAGIVEATISYIIERRRGLVVILWGNEAQKLEPACKGAIVIKGCHPAARAGQFAIDGPRTLQELGAVLTSRGEMLDLSTVPPQTATTFTPSM